MSRKATAQVWRELAANGKLRAVAGPVRLTCDKCRRPVGRGDYARFADAARAARVHLIDYPGHNRYVRYWRGGTFELQTDMES